MERPADRRVQCKIGSGFTFVAGQTQTALDCGTGTAAICSRPFIHEFSAQKTVIPSVEAFPRIVTFCLTPQPSSAHPAMPAMHGMVSQQPACRCVPAGGQEGASPGRGSLTRGVVLDQAPEPWQGRRKCFIKQKNKSIMNPASISQHFHFKWPQGSYVIASCCYQVFQGHDAVCNNASSSWGMHL